MDWDLSASCTSSPSQSGKVGTVRTAGSGDAAMVANKLYVIFDEGRGEHVVVKPDEIAAVKVLTKEETPCPLRQRVPALARVCVTSPSRHPPRPHLNRLRHLDRDDRDRGARRRAYGRPDPPQPPVCPGCPLLAKVQLDGHLSTPEE